MNFTQLRLWLVVSLMVWACGPAQAALFSYTGNTLTNGGHVTATADLSYNGAGSYIFGSGLNAYSLSAYDSSNSLVFSQTDTSPGFSSGGLVNYLTFDGSGSVTNWSLYLDDLLNQAIYTLGNDFGPPSNCGCGTQEGWVDRLSGDHGQTLSNAGSWSSQVPEPGSLALLGLALGGLGFSRRMKAKRAA